MVRTFAQAGGYKDYGSKKMGAKNDLIDKDSGNDQGKRIRRSRSMNKFPGVGDDLFDRPNIIRVGIFGIQFQTEGSPYFIGCNEDLIDITFSMGCRDTKPDSTQYQWGTWIANYDHYDRESL